MIKSNKQGSEPKAKPSGQLVGRSLDPIVGRLEIASRILSGFCANPAVFSHNPNCGWALVNCTDADLAGYALTLADALIDGERTRAPNPMGQVQS